MNVLSLFNGMSFGMMALEALNIKVDNYYSSEIDKYANQATKSLYSNIIQLGDVTKWQDWEFQGVGFNLGEVDLLLAGFPCQAWSMAGKQKGDNDPRGALVHDLINIWQQINACRKSLGKKPVKFMFENVRMKKEFLEYINNLFGVDPICINSALVSAQNRVRYYWSNIPGITQPRDKGILLKDIVHENIDIKNITPNFNINPSGKGMNGLVRSANNNKSNTLTTNKGEGQKISFNLNEYIVPFEKTLQILDKEVQRGKVGYFRKDSQANRVYYIHDKAVTLCGEAGGGAAKMGQYLFGCITPGRLNKRQNGQRFNDGRKFYTLTAQDNHGVLIEGYIRKLTPTECFRLQTVPKDHIETLLNAGISNSQLYKMAGNGWTMEVIKHIFNGLIN